MNSIRLHAFTIRAALCLAAAQGLSGPRSLGQEPPEPVRDFQVSDYDRETGHRNWVLRGQSARNVSDEEWALTGASMVLFNKEGATNVTVAAPDCRYLSKARQVDSPGQIQVVVGEGRFSIEGAGFEFRQADMSLMISNDVRAMVRKDLMAHRSLVASAPQTAVTPASPAAVAGLLHITSDAFNFRGNLAVFRDRVRVNDPQGTLNCRTLTIQFTEPDRQIESILAETEVVVEAEDFTATGQAALYQLTNDLITLTGDPSWRTGEREGRAQRVTFARGTRQFGASGEVRMRLPAETIHPAGLLPARPAAPDPARKAEPWEVYCDDFGFGPDELVEDTHLALCNGNVRVLNDRGVLTCGSLAIRSSMRDGRTQSVVAETRVVMEQQENHASCDRAVYLAGEETLEMTGAPVWRLDEREGSADRLRLDLRSRRYHAAGSVLMRLPAGSFGDSPWLLPAPVPVEPAVETSPPPAGTGRPIEITSDEFEFISAALSDDLDAANYSGRVKVTDPGRMSLECQVLKCLLAPGSGTMTSVIADRDVSIRVKSDAGERVGTGERAVYSGARQEITLTGSSGVALILPDEAGITQATGRELVYHRNEDAVVLAGEPRIVNPKGELTGDSVILDRGRTLLKATGNWRLLLQTNAFERVVPVAPRSPATPP